MKRLNHLFDKICSIENLTLADALAQKGKSKQPGVIAHNTIRETDITRLHQQLLNGDYQTSPYTCFKIYEPKERLIFKLPYYPDRILHHAIINIIGPVFYSTFTADTYSCIKGKGVHAAARGVKEALKDQAGTTYCLKLDIKKFYPSIDHHVLKTLLRKKFKDNDLLSLLDEIIDSVEGLPIGNYLSQYFANFYLTYFDHWMKQAKGVKYYFRYADDLVILSDNKTLLHSLLADIRQYLAENLKLTVKSNYQVFPVEARGIDFVGYKFFHTHTLLRKRIKQSFAKAIATGKDTASIASYTGWAKHCDSKNLVNKLLKTA